MAKLRTGDKVDRVVKFLMGLRDRRVATVLAKHGFSQDELDNGWRLLRAVVGEKLDIPLAGTIDKGVLGQLDAWENRWFPIVRASLTHRFPSIGERVFMNLSQTAGNEVIVSVSTLIERVEALASGTGEDQAARALLAQRGLDDAAIAAARDLLDTLGTVEAAEPGDSDAVVAQEMQAEEAMWGWYLEWSAIARATISDRRLLRLLGFGGRRRSAGQSSANDADAVGSDAASPAAGDVGEDSDDSDDSDDSEMEAASEAGDLDDVAA
ncbi:MAG: hypothetical protein AAGC55_22255 [Myxococcota bacterium]